MPDHRFHDSLRALAEEAGRTGRLAPAAELRRRGEARRRRRRFATTALGVALAGLLTVGVVAGWPHHRQTPVPPAVRRSSAPSSTPSVLSGSRAVHVVRVQAPDKVLVLGDELLETTSTGGRQRFVPVPLGDGTFQIKGYRTDEAGAQCWRLENSAPELPLTVWAAPCAKNDPNQRFTISAHGSGAYAISISSAFLQESPATGGLIFKKLGEASLPDTFRLVDDGPAPH